MESPYAYDQAVQAATRILELMRPLGEVVVPVEHETAEIMGKAAANGVIYSILSNPPTGIAKDQAPLLRTLLGSLVRRLRSSARGAK